MYNKDYLLIFRGYIIIYTTIAKRSATLNVARKSFAAPAIQNPTGLSSLKNTSYISNSTSTKTCNKVSKN